MSEEFREVSSAGSGDKAAASSKESLANEAGHISWFTRWMETLARLGLGETVIRIGANVLTVFAILLVAWLVRSFFKDAPLPNQENPMLAAATPLEQISVSAIPTPGFEYRGIGRQAMLHTIIPNRPRVELTYYTVVEGDTVFGIAEKYGLKPQTIMWGNYYSLRDDSHNLKPGKKLNILPVDGVYHEWQAGDGLTAVAKFFQVTPEDIINYPANRLSADAIGSYGNPNIEPGTWLIIPGGKRDFYAWSVPVGVTRDNEAVARQLGPGSCGKILNGAVGFGSFIWPANKHYLSGFDYSPETNHRGIDVAGNTGEGVYAADAGVIVYAGWNDYGYGEMIVVDHGTGWQTLYAHLSGINVVCGQSVAQGGVIGAIGSTGRSSGPHLHFELMHSQYGKVNPHLYLPPP